MSWFRAQFVWRQTDEMASADSPRDDCKTIGHKSRLMQNCYDNQDHTNEAASIKRRKIGGRMIGADRQRGVRNPERPAMKRSSNAAESPIIDNPSSRSSLLPLAGRGKVFSLPVASSATAPRLVPTKREKENDDKRICCQLINNYSTMKIDQASVTYTSQLKARNQTNCNIITKRRQAPTNSVAMFMCTLVGLLLALALANGQQQQQRFEVQPETQYLVQNGQEVRLRCLVRNRQGECLWLRNGRAIGLIAKKYAFVRQPEDGDCSLVIRNVSVQQDDGQWQCQVTPFDLEQDTLQSRETQLVVLVPPERPQIKNATHLYQSKHKQQLVLEENLPSTIVCELKGGNPAPQIEWILDGKNITKEASQSSAFLGSSTTQTASTRVTQSRLRVADIKRSMNGKNLTCVGVHPTGSHSSSAELNVQYMPSVSVPQGEYSIVEGSPLSIRCQVDSNPPPSDVSWRPSNDGKQSQPIRQGALLSFERTSRDLNQNIFQCFAENNYGLSEPANVKLNVLYPPTALNTSSSESVQVGNEAQLACLFEGNPRPEIRWLFTDPLSRSQGPVLLDNPDKRRPQFLTIKNVTYRNEGDYHCEARNQINGQDYYMRSSNIMLDVFGEPQFLVKSPFVAKVIQGTKSDISLTFCSDPAPNKVYWYFGSMRLEVRLNSINNGQQLTPAVQVAHPSGSDSKSPINHRFQVHPLQPLQVRNTSLSLVATCFEAKLTILDPELTDQRDFSLVVSNERGLQTGIIRLRVASPLSPMLMISSAFVTICGLFLFSLLVIFLLKKRHDSTTTSLHQNGAGSQQSGEKGAGSVEHLVNNSANGISNTNGLLQHAQTHGIVNGAGNGLANGAANPANGLMGPNEVGKHHHNNLMSMASSDTSGDQKQLLTNSFADRNSPSVSGNTNTGAEFNVNSSGSRTSLSNHSTPSPLNHISVEHDFHHPDNEDGSTYLPAESVTNDAELSPHNPMSRHANGALIYANLDYSEQQQQQHPTMAADSPPIYRAPSQQGRVRQQVPVDTSTMGHSPTSSSSTTDSRLQVNSSIRRHAANRNSASRSSTSNSSQPSPPSQGRPSVGATIALMNSLAAASSSNPNPNPSSPSTGVLNGAIQQQLAGSKQIRKPGPPKPPKPSIQQRSRFYQQQQLASLADGGDSSNGLVMIGSHNQRPISGDQQATTNDQLAAEYSRLAFPARAEL